jgi:hypothetical protein
MQKRINNFFIVFIIAGVIIFSLFYAWNKNYQSQTLIIFYPKNQTSYQDLNVILANAEVIGKSLKLHDQLFKVDSTLVISTLEKNKADWDKMLKIKRLANSSVLKINFIDPDYQKVQKLSKNYLKLLMPELAKYFNIETEVGFSLLEDTTISKVNQWRLSQIIWFGIVGGILISWLLNSFSGKIRNRKLIKKIDSLKDLKFSNSKKKTSKKTEVYLNELVQKEKKNLVKKTKAPSNLEKGGVAPLNLPLAGDEIEKMFGATKNGLDYKTPKIKKGTIQEETLEETSPIKEAAPEEVKERLNKLLRSI